MNDDEMAQDRTGELAEILGMPARDFAELFGAGWTENDGPVWHDYDSDPSGGGGLPVTPWMIAGDPPQLMIRVFHHGVFLAQPEGEWRHGSHGLEYRPGLQRYLPSDEFGTRGPEMIGELLRRRRRTFRYCRFCRGLTPPELRIDKDVCMGCGTEWYGVVY
ncbi:hypothetical protein GCM10009844_24000 [Nocardioides koreensis]|uniref:Uncharacterized protein n=1 Tax=Nocardioides koreensis TaxID=433651 RepID=A0ABN2ZT87_9ACTN